ncbi:unnamed protein product [Polarella glacialis]|uniref:Uncharacterized protein n=1 Tax=Polarella glacialis TaxID=89957 RepID=A0A813IGN7_POLGL|nr:unnamed protein product [Polarella glacialis]
MPLLQSGRLTLQVAWTSSWLMLPKTCCDGLAGPWMVLKGCAARLPWLQQN